VDSAEIIRKLDQAKQAKARLEGQRDRLEAELKALGHETIQSAKDELERLEQNVARLKPELDTRVAKFLADHGDTLATFASGR
jgi:chaperonin cofactor prefoldin